MDYKEGDVWVLSDGREYIIVKLLQLGTQTYAMLLTEEQPIEMKLGTMITKDGEVAFRTTTDREQALYILEAMINNTK